MFSKKTTLEDPPPSAAKPAMLAKWCSNLQQVVQVEWPRVQRQAVRSLNLYDMDTVSKPQKRQVNIVILVLKTDILIGSIEIIELIGLKKERHVMYITLPTLKQSWTHCYHPKLHSTKTQQLVYNSEVHHFGE